MARALACAGDATGGWLCAPRAWREGCCRVAVGDVDDVRRVVGEARRDDEAGEGVFAVAGGGGAWEVDAPLLEDRRERALAGGRGLDLLIAAAKRPDGATSA